VNVFDENGRLRHGEEAAAYTLDLLRRELAGRVMALDVESAQYGRLI
jgi:hypothetical protein